jgi:uncharacterized membrane protein YGL010W
MLRGRSWEDWIGAYERGHQHPVNRATHVVGIPMILLSLPLLLAGIWSRAALLAGLVLFVVGWVLQVVGHLAERQPPEFFHDWRFLLVGARWWLSGVWRR